ncbi:MULTISPECIES: hypothetical protein [Burkholderia]|uniref:Uncharacterized protein n=1 Tax=Burkholderia savannae TaxID=1637837 RepID=A0ABR5T3E2_9BURK|nr:MULTISPECIES: hypothetical protein [Burkholderia]AOJ71075.1 hypothetical protein WS78_19515 [Burkholderia savannae]AOK49469.1 hypothetical protein WT60_21335 [Burkholderia sp. MSMB617WGS]KGS08276.1 hypothetical protein X946_384 [Burkholderia sp. ABCPW 111]KVG48860.1 hypothetical protein WS77_03830 [Burkholderia sp. MSMB0265]KVG86320.1 hypothetical protein WS81_30500 [Burkholderia sp. MSMB2040]
MKKLLIATVIGALSATMLAAAPSAFAQDSSTTAKKATPKRPAPKRHLIPRSKKAQARAAAKTDPMPEGAVKWSCKDGLSYDLAGDMKRDQIVTVHWANKNYKLPRQQTTTGADVFYDPASGMKLVVIPTKGMLFSDKDDSRLADECQTPEMAAGNAVAPTQSNELKPAN